MSQITIILIHALVAFILSWIVYPWVYKFAVRHHIMDMPTQRKCQQHPIPLMGGIAILLGAIIPLITIIVMHYTYVWLGILLFTISMLILGGIDDWKGLSVRFRFLIETILVGLFITNLFMIDNFYGLWGVTHLSIWISIPLSILAGVGIINSINLIDGVDGYSSGYAIIAFTIFAIVMIYVHKYTYACLLLILAASTIPFYYHNTFGKKKMYIGDGGTLMIGAVLSTCVFYLLSNQSVSEQLMHKNIGIVAFCMAVLCIPVFDTLRVMYGRIRKGGSPFVADTTHLHHLFLAIGFSHLQTSLAIIAINTFIVGIWWIAYLLGATIDIQLYIVLALGILSTFGLGVVLQQIAKDKTKKE